MAGVQNLEVAAKFFVKFVDLRWKTYHSGSIAPSHFLEVTAT